MTTATASALDADDPLGEYIDQFVPLAPGLIYFDGNSLGRLPRRTVTALEAAVTDGWAGRLVRGWDEWVDLPLTVGDRVGRAVLGAAAGQVAVCDNTTVNLQKLAGAALADRPGGIVTDPGNFPTDRYVLAALGPVTWRPVGADIPAGTSLVSFSAVDYRTGEIADIPAITEAAHAAGARVLWDCSHAAGSVPLELDAWNVDLAVGCTYKYLNGGPGAPAWLYVRTGLELDNPIPGWFSTADQFAMGPSYEPAAGPRRFLTGTPPVLALVCVDASVAMIEEAGMGAIRAKGRALVEFAATTARALGFEVASPPPQRCGSHIALRHPDARSIVDAGLATGVVTDFREPDIIRIGMAPLTTRFTDVEEGLGRLAAAW